MPNVSLPRRPFRTVKVLLPPDPEDDGPTPESIAAAWEAMWRERYAIQLMTGVLITDDGRIILPPKES